MYMYWVGIVSSGIIIKTLENEPTPLFEEPLDCLSPWAYISEDYGTHTNIHTDIQAYTRVHILHTYMYISPKIFIPTCTP